MTTERPDDDWRDDYDPFRDDPAEVEAAIRRAEEPPDWYLEELAEREHQRHLDEEHGGLLCDCPPYEPPRCRLLLRLPRWGFHHGWQAGTPDGCLVALRRSPRAAWRAHREFHRDIDKPPF